MDNEKMRSWIALKYKFTAVMRARYTTSRVQVAVTNGLPSRSPPIQDENLYTKHDVNQIANTEIKEKKLTA